METQCSPRSNKTVRFTDTNIFKEIFDISNITSSITISTSNDEDDKELLNNEFKFNVNNETGLNINIYLFVFFKYCQVLKSERK